MLPLGCFPYGGERGSHTLHLEENKRIKGKRGFQQSPNSIQYTFTVTGIRDKLKRSYPLYIIRLSHQFC